MDIWFINYSDEWIGDKKIAVYGEWKIVYLYKKSEINRKYFSWNAILQRYLEKTLKTLSYNIVIEFSPAFLGSEGALE